MISTLDNKTITYHYIISFIMNIPKKTFFFLIACFLLNVSSYGEDAKDYLNTFHHVRKRGVRWYFGAVGPIVTGLLIFVYFAKPFGSSRTDNQRNFLFCLGFGMDTNFCFAAFVDRYMVLSKKIT